MFIGRLLRLCFSFVTSSILRNVETSLREAPLTARTHYGSETATKFTENTSFLYMEGESCRSRLGDALSPGKDFKFPYIRLRAYVYFDFVMRIGSTCYFRVSA